jgi:hypothetical protein
MAAPIRQRVCDHAGHECFGANSKHKMLCACGCGKVFELNDPDRLRWAPGWGGNWYTAKHGPNRLDRPEPADSSPGA